MTRAPSDSAISRDPSLLPLSTMTISLQKLWRAMYERALAMQIGSVLASFRQGIKMVSVTSSSNVIRLEVPVGEGHYNAKICRHNNFARSCAAPHGVSLT